MTLPGPGEVLRGLVVDAVDDEGRGRAMVKIAADSTLEVAIRGAMPGDVVDVAVERVFAVRGLAQARRLGPLGPGAGPLHVARRCAHQGPCPACPLHGVDEGFVQSLKRSRVERALLDAGVPGDVVRATLQDTVFGGGIRQKVKLVIAVGDDDASLVFGHYVPHSHVLVEAGGCALADDGMQRAVALLRERLQTAGVPAAVLRAVILRRFEEGIAAILVAVGPCPVPLASLWPTEALLGLGWRMQSSTASDNAIVGGTVDDDGVVGVVAGTPLGGGAPVVVDSFCQADSEGAAWLVDKACAHVMEGIGPRDVVLDLYAGAGAFARGLLAHGARQVVAVESFPASVEALGRLSPLVRAVGGRVEDVIDGVLDDAVKGGPRGAVVDPPRKGLGPVALRLGRGTSLARLALVSCDVDAGAKDAKALMDAGFVVDAVIPVDLFRGSAEVEVLTLLSRR